MPGSRATTDKNVLIERLWRILDQDGDGKLNLQEARYMIAVGSDKKPEDVHDRDIKAEAENPEIIPMLNITHTRFLDLFTKTPRGETHESTIWAVQGMIDQLAAWGRTAPKDLWHAPRSQRHPQNMAVPCYRCTKPVYRMEQFKCLDKIWHKGVLCRFHVFHPCHHD